jgi:hypothetical protein
MDFVTIVRLLFNSRFFTMQQCADIARTVLTLPLDNAARYEVVGLIIETAEREALGENDHEV